MSVISGRKAAQALVAGALLATASLVVHAGGGFASAAFPPDEPLRLAAAGTSAVAPGGTASAAAAHIAVTDAWVRASVPGLTATGAFLTLTSATPARLVGAASPAAASVELHESIEEAGVKKMRPVAAIDLPAGTPVSLAPGGFHLMLNGLKAPAAEGATLPLTLLIDDGSTRRQIEVTATVRALTTPATDSPHQHRH
ncbi:copper chaperone PCu(A)C [Derxia lacustris]|uniref:copper chaperone PCu(A)C n=1 Tax=Derxia lacustris TaxID=764842 RepID=UPI000A176530|nr:copper chaperone PCu(A)C [Derxia lacustris]